MHGAVFLYAQDCLRAHRVYIMRWVHIFIYGVFIAPNHYLLIVLTQIFTIIQRPLLLADFTANMLM